MKKIFLALALMPTLCFAQWTYKRVDNGLDDPYNIAYNQNKQGSILKLENIEGEICFYLSNGYFCEDNPITEVAFKIGEQWSKFEFRSAKSTDNSALFLTFNLNGDPILTQAFKSASLVRIRVNDGICGSDIYDFSMGNSTNAFNFMLK
jgi:hypothetical protein